MESNKKINSSSSYYNTNYQYSAVHKDEDGDKMHGIRRVLTFCLLTTVLPSILIVIPLYLRNIKYSDVMYKVSDSDVIQIHQGQSSIFCRQHSLKMNTTFNAFQMRGEPAISNKTKHIQLKKSMILPDDTLEYWGFYLMKGATVELNACSRYDGSKILVVKGDRILNTCNILNNDKTRVQTKIVNNQGDVIVTLESPESSQPPKVEITKEEKENDAREHLIDDIDDEDLHEKRNKRDTKPQTLHKPNTILDTGVNHGGNAGNATLQQGIDNSVSSFENSLYQCYSGNILINEFFPFAEQCKSTKYLEMTPTLKVIHEVSQDGYYYYIFYSDNDIVQNDIHAIFDIYKPTFQYSNISKSKMCINSTECLFQVGFLSDESVIVEVPTRDGIEYNEDDSSILISVCIPRMTVYIFFPVAVLLLILIFAFL